MNTRHIKVHSQLISINTQEPLYETQCIKIKIKKPTKNPFHLKLSPLRSETNRNIKHQSEPVSVSLPYLTQRNNISEKYSTQYCDPSYLKKCIDYKSNIYAQSEETTKTYFFPTRSTITPLMLFSMIHKKKDTSELSLEYHSKESNKEFPLRPVKENLIRNICLLRKKASSRNDEAQNYTKTKFK